MKNKSYNTRLTIPEVLSLAISSVKMTGGLDYFWNEIRTMRVNSFSEIRQIIADHNDLIFRRGRGITMANTDTNPYDTDNPYTDEIEGDEIAGFQYHAIDIKPLRDEIPNYGMIIQGKGHHPVRVHLIEYQYILRDTFVVQPVFKVVAEYQRVLIKPDQSRIPMTRGHAPRQLFIIGRDRHTKDPFALAVPNGLIKRSIDTCLRWTMDVHKGDIVEEV
jgi:hypothetical protein